MGKKPPSNVTQLAEFLSYLTTVKGDLSNVSPPPFLLSPRSVTEIPATWAERHELFLAPAAEPDPARRALLVLKNYLCSLQRQAYAASGAPGVANSSSSSSDSGAKKPLNAFLGELFLGTWEGPDGSTTQLIAEQVSHHPPVTACCTYNRAHGIASAGYAAQETSVSAGGGVRVQQVGHSIVRDERHRESHLMTLPTLAIKGLLTGRPYPEFEGVCYIASSSGYRATIEFAGKSSLGIGGTKNSVRARIANVRDGDAAVFEIRGQWTGRLQIRDFRTNTTLEMFHVDEVPLTELRVAPLEAQSPWESRRAWTGVCVGIRDSDTRRVREEKDCVEEAQRGFRAAEEEAGVEWPSVFFRRARTPRHQEFELLAQVLPQGAAASLQPEKTAGVWRFVGVGAAERLLGEGQYHSPLEPTTRIGAA